MKRVQILATLSLFSSISLFAVTGTEIEELFSEIMSKERSDLKGKITSMNDPFSSVQMPSEALLGVSQDANNDKNATEQTYTLRAVINSSAKINNNWYGVGDKIDAYKVGSIKDDWVLLLPSGATQNLQSKKLTIEDSNNLNVKAVKLNEKKQPK